MLARVRIVDSGIQDGPALAGGGALKIPIAEYVSIGLAITNGVVCGHETTFHAKINTEERIRFVLSSAVLCVASNKAFNLASMAY